MHFSVLQKEVLEYLNPKTNENFVDATIGEGGYTLAILEKTAPHGRVLGIDFELRIKPTKRLLLAEGNFAELKNIVQQKMFCPVHGVLFDLGMSKWHLEKSGRGFSFKRTEPLDMRYSPKSNLKTAEKIINYYSKFELERIFKEYGQDPKANKIAQLIVETRSLVYFKTTKQLMKIIDKVGTDPQRIFQALRIEVNNELDNLKIALPQALEILRPKARLVVISFHSLEDRLVKNFFRESSEKGQLKVLTKKPITPTIAEIKINPSSRSAKLRAAVKT